MPHRNPIAPFVRHYTESYLKKPLEASAWHGQKGYRCLGKSDQPEPSKDLLRLLEYLRALSRREGKSYLTIGVKLAPAADIAR